MVFPKKTFRHLQHIQKAATQAEHIAPAPTGNENHHFKFWNVITGLAKTARRITTAHHNNSSHSSSFHRKTVRTQLQQDKVEAGTPMDVYRQLISLASTSMLLRLIEIVAKTSSNNVSDYSKCDETV